MLIARLSRFTVTGAILCVLLACSDRAVQNSPAPVAPNVTIIKWGPQVTKASQGFSVQSNGNSALWFEQRGIQSAPSVEVWFDQTRLPGVVINPDQMGSAEVPSDLLTRPGRYPVYLKVLPNGTRVELGIFEVVQ